jgi:cytochrome b561
MRCVTDIDPIRARRAQVAKWTQIANRSGYLLYAAAIAVFVVGYLGSFNSTISTIVIICLIAGSALLAPAIILGYAVKAAERHDREQGL